MGGCFLKIGSNLRIKLSVAMVFCRELGFEYPTKNAKITKIKIFATAFMFL